VTWAVELEEVRLFGVEQLEEESDEDEYLVSGLAVVRARAWRPSAVAG
jgi:hypothetical protein